MSTISQKRNATMYDHNRKTKGHAGITPHGLCETVLQALQIFHLGANSVQVEVPVWGVMELPTIQADQPASTCPPFKQRLWQPSGVTP